MAFEYRTASALVIFFLLVLMIGCEDKPRTAFDDYGDALIDTYQRGQHTGDIANLDALKKAIDMYRIENGNYPSSLDDIQNFIRMDIDLSKYEYDSSTGVVALRQ